AAMDVLDVVGSEGSLPTAAVTYIATVSSSPVAETTTWLERLKLTCTPCTSAVVSESKVCESMTTRTLPAASVQAIRHLISLLWPLTNVTDFVRSKVASEPGVPVELSHAFSHVPPKLPPPVRI